MDLLILQCDKIKETNENLLLRIRDRFPDSSLARICQRLSDIARETEQTVERISRPNILLRTSSYIAIAALVCTVIYIVLSFKAAKNISLEELIQTSEAGTNLLIFLCLAVYFLWTLELKIKRNKVIKSINALKDLAHIIDMHQLIKDPEGISESARPTAHSPSRDFDHYQMARYLDYCSELLSLISKIGYLYVNRFHDPVAMSAADELESLATGLSGKIWQKIMILESVKRAEECADEGSS